MSKKALRLETDLLKVSQPYGILAGDFVRNIHPRCPHYRSTGKVVAVDLDGKVTYQVNNQGATFKPGDLLTKPVDQLLKVFTHSPRPGYGMFSNE
jgi:hypothetical protein